MLLTDSATMKEADRNAIELYDIPSTELMENAAEAVASTAVKFLAQEERAVVFSSTGNNGGDGIAAACNLIQEGFPVSVYLIGNREKMTADTREMAQRLYALGGEILDFPDDGKIWIDFSGVGVIVDALFGIGLNRPLEGAALRAVQMINSSGVPVVSCDIASGVDADTGAILGDAVRAAVTVSFSMAKVGHFASPGCACCGELCIVDIGIPGEFVTGCGIRAVMAEDLSIPPRKRDAHKGDFGKILVVGGSIGYTGAPTLCAKAALRTGAGLVSLGVPEPIYGITATKNDEAMPFPLAADSSGRLSVDAIPAIMEKLSDMNAAVVGPGLGRGEEVTKLVFRMIMESEQPLVLDADALNALAENTDILLAAKSLCILTPHEGEFARLLGRPVENRIGDAFEFAMRYKCIVVLKGQATVIAYPTREIYLNTSGSPALAKGGTGDVLSGVIAAMLCRLPAREAVITAVWLHGRAGDICEERFGENGVLATDVIHAIPEAMQEISERK